MQQKRPHQTKIVLRGGKGNFNPRTLIGNWEEDREVRPAPRFVLRPGYETTKGAAELEAVGTKQTHYGNGIQAATLKPSSTIHYQSKEVTGEATSITRLAFDSSDKNAFASQFGSRFPLKPARKLKREEVDAYRRDWSADPGREERFLTEKTTYQNKALGPAFQVSHIRKLPNVPVFVQDLQRSLILRHGLHALHLLHKVFRCYDADGSGTLSKPELRELLLDLDMALSHDSTEALFRYFDRDASGAIDHREFVETLSGSLSPSRRAVVLEAWERLDIDGVGFVYLDDMLGRFRLDSVAPGAPGDRLLAEIAAQFPRQWHASAVAGQDMPDSGARGDAIIDCERFLDYYRRLSPAISDDASFEGVVRASWGQV